MKRLFIAVDISDEARRLASDIIHHLQNSARLNGISWVKPENLHVTIKFLGDTDESRAASVIEMLHTIASDTYAFALRLDAPEILGKRVLSIKISSNTPTIFALEQRIDVACEQLGFKREGRRFHPHLTLARIRDAKVAARIVQEFRGVQIAPAEFEVKNVTLYESKLMSSGSVYNALNSASLRF